MTETRAEYQVLNTEANRATLEQRSGFVRVLDPQTGRFLFEYHPGRDLIAWTDRGRRIEIDLRKYRE